MIVGYNKKALFSILIILTILVFVVACGGGGGGSGGGSNPAGQSDSLVTGVASKGLISGGTVEIHAIGNNGQTVTPALATGTTGNDGSYSLSIGEYTGSILVEVTSGEYIDEATGSLAQISEPLRAALPSVDDDVQVAVSPLTELAVRLAEAGGGFSPTKIGDANALLSQLLGDSADIIATLPVDPENGDAFAAASAEAQNYTLLLAAISQMAETTGQDVTDVIQSLEEDLQDLTLDNTGGSLASAIADFIASGDNHTGTSEATVLTSIINDIVAEGLSPTGSLTEAKELLAKFLNEPSEVNYDTLIDYLNVFTPASEEAYLFKAIASLMNIYQSSAAEFITSGQDGFNWTNLETFDGDQFVDSLLRSASLNEDLIGLFAEVAARLGDAYANLELAEGVKTAISLTGFDTVYLDDVDVKILKFITKSLQAVFIFAQAVNLEVDNWMVSGGTVDVRDLLNIDQDLSDAQEAEFMANNPNLFGYSDLSKLADFRTAFSQAATDLATVVAALDGMGAAGREARSQNGFNIDSDLDFYMTKGLSEQTMASLVAAMDNSTSAIVTLSDEEIGGTLTMAEDGYTYMQTEYNIYQTTLTPAQGAITLYDLAHGEKSLRDLLDASQAVDEYEPYIEGGPTLYQGGILDIEWDRPIESFEMPVSTISIDGNANDWNTVPVFQSINNFTIKIATGQGDDYYIYIENLPIAAGEGSYYSLYIGNYWPWWEFTAPPTEAYFRANLYLNTSTSATLSGSEYGQNEPTYLPVDEADKALFFNNDGSVVGLEIKFSQLNRLTVENYINTFYFNWNINGVDGYRWKEIKIYP